MEISVSQFKAKCLSVVERVQREKVRVVISRHGHAAAMLVPMDGDSLENPLFGRALGQTEILADILSSEETWDVER